ncbi:MAG: hypothetical protein AAFW70_31205, partial [Cyanobacteria bacterium J06635_10]
PRHTVKVATAAPIIVARGKTTPLFVTITRGIQIASIPPLIPQIIDVAATRPAIRKFFGVFF